jgi:hypothetical protein
MLLPYQPGRQQQMRIFSPVEEAEQSTFSLFLSFQRALPPAIKKKPFVEIPLIRQKTLFSKGYSTISRYSLMKSEAD